MPKESNIAIPFQNFMTLIINIETIKIQLMIQKHQSKTHS